MKILSPPVEAERIAVLKSYRILDTATEDAFDHITHLAALLLGVPIAVIDFVDTDRVWCKSRYGLNLAEVKRDESFSLYTLQARGVTIVPDTKSDERFARNSLVICEPRVRFYAGVPLVTKSGFPLGTLSIMDTRPRELSAEQRATLLDLGHVITNELETRLMREQKAQQHRAAGYRAHAAKQPARLQASTNDSFLEQYMLAGELRHALERGELSLHYQPQLELATGRVIGFEALLRWNHPQYGMISPYTFIPIAEETGLIVQIGTWVLREACRQCRLWQSSGMGALRIAINVSLLQFDNPNFADLIESVLTEFALPPHLLELELTETVAMQHIETITAMLDRLHAIGVSIALDDFGTGYASLSYLQHLPVDTLKIDRAFLRDISERPHHSFATAAIIRAITMLAHSLGIRVVAEGAETKIQQEFLFSIGCDGLQGYLFSPPLPAKAFDTFLLQQIGPSANPDGPVSNE